MQDDDEPQIGNLAETLNSVLVMCDKTAEDPRITAAKITPNGTSTNALTNLMDQLAAPVQPLPHIPDFDEFTIENLFTRHLGLGDGGDDVWQPGMAIRYIDTNARDFNDPEVVAMVSSTESILRPRALRMCFRRLGDDPDIINWSAEITDALESNGVRFCLARNIACDGTSVAVLVYHLSWRFFIYVVLLVPEHMRNETFMDSGSDKFWGMRFLGYYYKAYTEKEAVENRCF